jgi:hypothetical protein
VVKFLTLSDHALAEAFALYLSKLPYGSEVVKHSRSKPRDVTLSGHAQAEALAFFISKLPSWQ